MRERQCYGNLKLELKRPGRRKRYECTHGIALQKCLGYPDGMAYCKYHGSGTDGSVFVTYLPSGGGTADTRRWPAGRGHLPWRPANCATTMATYRSKPILKLDVALPCAP